MGVSRHGTELTVWVRILDAHMYDHNDRYKLEVVDFNSDEGFGKPFIIHQLTKTIKMSGWQICLL